MLFERLFLIGSWSPALSCQFSCGPKPSGMPQLRESRLFMTKLHGTRFPYEQCKVYSERESWREKNPKGLRAMRRLDQAANISATDKELLREIKRVIRDFLPNAQVLLYGSVARGTHGPESDYDVLVLTDEVLDTREEGKVRSAVFDVELTCDVVISTQFYARAQWNTPLYRAMPFHQEVDRDAILI